MEPHASVAHATLGRSQDVWKGVRLLVEDERSIVSSGLLFKRSEVHDQEEENTIWEQEY